MMKYIQLLQFVCVSLMLTVSTVAQVKDDVNTPLHLLPAAYSTPYQSPDKSGIKQVMDKVFGYISQVTPASLVDTITGKPVSAPAEVSAHTALKRGTFRITSYEWGVVYSALLNAYENTRDTAYLNYVSSRQAFIAQWAPVFRELEKKGTFQLRKDFTLHQPAAPKALDDGGAVAASMIKAKLKGAGSHLDQQIGVYVDYIRNKEFRLPDNTLARNRPLPNTLWLDDLYMAIPALAQMGKLKQDNSYYDDALHQVFSYAKRMFVPANNLFMHGWVQGMTTHPAFHWARANGWALLAMTELLNVLPKDHPQREALLELYRKHVSGIVKCQDGTGFWHQLLDRSDSYLETSATAIYTYCIAKGCNEGWLDALAYAPTAALGWHAAASKVNAQGQVEGTCVGTGMAFDPAFYYHRPISSFAAHGYGPVLWAASEMYKLLDLGTFRINDSALIFYPKDSEKRNQ